MHTLRIYINFIESYHLLHFFLNLFLTTLFLPDYHLRKSIHAHTKVIMDSSSTLLQFLCIQLMIAELIKAVILCDIQARDILFKIPTPFLREILDGLYYSEADHFWKF